MRLAWLGHKEGVTESDKVVELEEFLRSVAALDGEPKQPAEESTGRARMSLAVDDIDDIDDALEALDDEVLSEEPAAGESVPHPLEADLPRQAQEVSQPPEIRLPAVDGHLDGADVEAALQAQAPLRAFGVSHANGATLEAALQPQVPGLDQRSDQDPRQAPPFEARPHQVDQPQDEAMSEAIPASDPIAPVLDLDQAPPLEPPPHQLDELQDEALSETFPTSDSVAVVLGLEQRWETEAREAPPFEPRPHEVDELLDEALSETFPASDPIAVSAVC